MARPQRGRVKKEAKTTEKDKDNGKVSKTQKNATRKTGFAAHYTEMKHDGKVKAAPFEMTPEFDPVVDVKNQLCPGCFKITTGKLSNHLTASCYCKDLTVQDKHTLTAYSKRFGQVAHEHFFEHLKGKAAAVCARTRSSSEPPRSDTVQAIVPLAPLTSYQQLRSPSRKNSNSPSRMPVAPIFQSDGHMNTIMNRGSSRNSNENEELQDENGNDEMFGEEKDNMLHVDNEAPPDHVPFEQSSVDHRTPTTSHTEVVFDLEKAKAPKTEKEYNYLIGLLESLELQGITIKGSIRNMVCDEDLSQDSNHQDEARITQVFDMPDSVSGYLEGRGNIQSLIPNIYAESDVQHPSPTDELDGDNSNETRSLDFSNRSNNGHMDHVIRDVDWEDDLYDYEEGDILDSATYNAETVPPNLLIINPESSEYTGGPAVHEIFNEISNLSNIFDLCGEEGFNEYLIARDISDTNSPLATLNLNLRLNIAKQPLLVAFRIFVSGDEMLITSTAKAYTSCIARISVPILKSRGRFTALLSADDIIFCAQVLSAMISEMIAVEVHYSILNQIMAALKKFLLFLKVSLNITCLQGLRYDCLHQLEAVMKNLSARIGVYERFVKFYADKDRAVLPYCMYVLLVKHQLVINKVNAIIDHFLATGNVTAYNYQYVLGHLLTSMIHLNSSRTEACYKLKLRDADPNRILSLQAELPSGTIEQFHVIRYKPPKNLRAKSDHGGQFAGLIVLDFQLKKEMDFYLTVRRSPNFPTDPNTPLFVKEDGAPMSTPNVYIRYFLTQIGQKDFPISCTDTRVAVAKFEFNNYVTDLIRKALEKRAIYKLAGHTMDVRIQNYIKDMCLAAIAAFIELRKIDYETKTANMAQFALLSNSISERLRPHVPSAVVLREPMSIKKENVAEKRSATSPDANIPKRAKKATSTATLDNVVLKNDLVYPMPEKEVTIKRETLTKKTEEIVFEEDALASQELQALMETAMLSEELQIPNESPLVADEVITALVQHNEIPCLVYPQMKPINEPEGAVDFLTRCGKKPVQGFQWLSVLNVEGAGMGVFAKCDIPSGVIVSDYSGLIQPKKVHEQWLESAALSETQRTTVADYRIGFDHKDSEFVVTGHQDVYKGSIVIGRLYNHSLHRRCCNVVGRPVFLQIGSIQHLKIIFRSTRKIKAGEQILWNYGRHFMDYDWYKKCANNFEECSNKQTLASIERKLTTRNRFRMPYIENK